MSASSVAVREGPATTGERPLVIALGGEGGDDAAPLVAAHELERACAGRVRVTTVSSAEPAGLQRLLRESDTVVVVGATRTGAPPGTVHRLASADLSPDDAGLARTIAWAAGPTPPRNLVLYAIEGRRFGRRAGVSPEAVRAAGQVADRAQADVLGAAG